MIGTVTSTSIWSQWFQSQQAAAPTSSAGDPFALAPSQPTQSSGTDPTAQTEQACGSAASSLQLPTEMFLALQSGASDGTAGTTQATPASGSDTGTPSSASSGQSLGDLMTQLQSLLVQIENDLTSSSGTDASGTPTDPTQQADATQPAHHHHYHHGGQSSTQTADSSGTATTGSSVSASAAPLTAAA